MEVLGNLASMGDIEKDPWIALSYYHLYEDISDDNPFYSQVDGKHRFMINLNDIEFAELWPNEGDQPKQKKKQNNRS